MAKFRVPKYHYQTEAMIIDWLLNYSEPLKSAYACFHDVMDAFRDKNPDLFIHILKELPETLLITTENVPTKPIENSPIFI